MADLSDIQALVVSQLGNREARDLLVSAGAGAGKTFVLVESLLAAMRADPPIPLDLILVVTFTDKAASEMRNRIYAELEKDERLASLRFRLPQAWISTIHSFCLRLLRERFEKAGVDPRFRVLPEEDARLLLEGALTRVFHDEYEKRSEPFEELVEMCGFDAGGERLREVIRRLLAYARSSERPDEFLSLHAARLRRPATEWAEFPWARDYGRRVARAWRTGIGSLRILVDAMGDQKKFASLLAKLEGIDAGLLADPSTQTAVRAQLESAGVVKEGEPLAIALPNLPRGMGEEFGQIKEEAAKALGSPWLADIPLDLAAVAADEGRASRLGLALIHLTQRVAEAYEREKDRLGRLDFEDLEIRALRLIRACEGGDSAIRFERAFIDEFQDVNGLQHEILSRVCDPAAVLRVGDIKQSIYQFRLADPKIIRSLAAGRPVVRSRKDAPLDAVAWNVLLPENYRSLKPILEAANAIARGIFLSSEIGSDYDEQRLVCGSDVDPVRDPFVEMLLIHEEDDAKPEGDDLVVEGSSEEEDPVKPDMRDSEWTAIAHRIREMYESKTSVRDPSTREWRPIQFSDIAILLRAHANGPALARRLEEEGIPCSLGTGESFFEAQEVRDLLNLLRITDNLLDDISLASALRSPAFGWSDAELLSLRLALPAAVHLAFSMAILAQGGETGGIADAILPRNTDERAVLCGRKATLPDEPPFSTLPERCREALALILGWREAAGRSELPALVVRVLDDTGLPRSVASLPGGLRRQANLRKLIGIARRYAQDAGHNLHRFLRWCESLEERNAKIFEAPVSSESVPAVRITTIHGAKGLEFPVVFLAEMGRRYILGNRTRTLVPGRDYLGIQLLDQEEYILHRPHPLRLLIDQGEDDGIAEEKRILYVALTRARDRLILSGVHISRTAPSQPLHALYQSARARRDEEGEAVMHQLLKRKPTPLAWVLYALPGIPGPEPGAGAAETARTAEPAGAGSTRPVPIDGLPITVRWIQGSARAESEPAPNPIRAIEGRLRALESVEIEGGPAAEAESAVARSVQRPPFPSPGFLATARGKIWATEFKSGRSLIHRIPRNAPEDGETDEGATPLVVDETLLLADAPPSRGGVGSSTPARRDADGGGGVGAAAGRAAGSAAEEGIAIHLLLERLTFDGLDAESLPHRVESAATTIGGLPPAAIEAVRAGLPALLASPIGKTLTGRNVRRERASRGGGSRTGGLFGDGMLGEGLSEDAPLDVDPRDDANGVGPNDAGLHGGDLHREVAFSLRVPFLEIARWMPQLRAEILASDVWREWIEPGTGIGTLRIRADRPSGAESQWVLVQGRIDVVMREGEGWRILDWKSDRVPPAGPIIQERIELYRGQMEIYRRAVEVLFGRPVRASLFFLRPGVLVEV